MGRDDLLGNLPDVLNEWRDADADGARHTPERMNAKNE